jgi:hypothetical protein
LREITTAVARTWGSPGGSGPELVVAVVVLAGARPQESASAAQITARLIGDAHRCFMKKE